MQNYLCSRCGTLLQSERTPINSNSCIDRKWHIWVSLGEYGNNIYRCEKCGILVHSERNPTNGNSCKGSRWHEWRLIQRAFTENTTKENKVVNKKTFEEENVSDKNSKGRYSFKAFSNDDEEEHRRQEKERRLEEERELERRNENEYNEWLSNQVCVFCGESGNIKEYPENILSHKSCIEKYITTDEGKDYLDRLKKAKEERQRKKEEEQKRAEMILRAIEERIADGEREKEQKNKIELELEKKRNKEEKRIKNIERLQRFVIFPLPYIVMMQFVFKINILPHTTNINVVFIASIIEYIAFTIISYYASENGLFMWGGESNLFYIIKLVVIHFVIFTISFFVLKFLAVFLLGDIIKYIK
ncbi:MAG: hypothetical protein LBJ98_04040 [Endomicrobium sp.]|jgi:hypothetical protein|nr:hypothetical protein [Endomicrobium sp.]